MGGRTNDRTITVKDTHEGVVARRAPALARERVALVANGVGRRGDGVEPSDTGVQRVPNTNARRRDGWTHQRQGEVERDNAGTREVVR